MQWTADGVAISTATNDQTVRQITSDGNGGAIITWDDSRNGNIDVYAQRVYGNGTLNGNNVLDFPWPMFLPAITNKRK